jgi:hypothetical protein
MCVTITRRIGRPSSSVANTCSHCALASSRLMQQSTTVQPSRPSSSVAQQPQVDVVQREGQGHADPAHAGRELDGGAGRGQGVAQRVLQFGSRRFMRAIAD